MRRVLVGTPAHDWRVDIRYLHSLTQSVRLCSVVGIELRELLPGGVALIQSARNDIVRDALKYGFDDLIFIDSDQDWEPEWIVKLLMYPVDCVGAAVRRKDDREMYNVKARGGPSSITTDPNTGLMTAPDMALGTGFLRFSRKALQLLWDNAEEYTTFLNDSPSRWIFDVRPHEGELRGEDTYVSDRLRELGIQTWLDPSMVCGHVGTKRWHGDFKAFLDAAKAHEAEEEKSGQLSPATLDNNVRSIAAAVKKASS
jgi:hypothetical protein